MTSNPCLSEAPIHRFPHPRVIAVEHFIGLDLGQVHDPTAIAVLENSEISIGRSLVTYESLTVKRGSFRHLERLPLGLDYPTIVEHVRCLVSSPELSRRTTLVVDATGVGRPVVDLLRRAQLPCRLMPVTITAGDRETQDSGTWRVPKRDLITGLLVLLQREEIDICGHLPESETLVKELGNIRIKVSLGGQDTYGAWREGEHDDLVLAAALACWRGAKKEQPFLGTRRLI
jgi:hypothetical protein